MQKVVEFYSVGGEIQSFLHPNEPPQITFWYLVIQFEAESSKIEHFQSLVSIFKAKYQLRHPKNDFLILISI